MKEEEEALRELLQREMAEKMEPFLREIENDPELSKKKAPPEIWENLTAQIEQYEKEKKEEEKELIRLGRIYKERKGRQKYFVAAVLAAVGIIGVTSFSEQSRLVRKFEWRMGDREKIMLNTERDGQKLIEAKVSDEEDAHQQVRDEFGFDPVRMDYRPNGLKFQEAIILDALQSAQIIYQDEKDGSISIKICINYADGSNGIDVEDKMIDTFLLQVQNKEIKISQYEVADSPCNKMSASFRQGECQYFIIGNHIAQQEFIKIIENLHFSY